MEKMQEIKKYCDQYAPQLKITDNQIKKWLDQHELIAKNLGGRILANNVINAFKTQVVLEKCEDKEGILLGVIDSKYRNKKDKMSAYFYNPTKKELFQGSWFGSLPKQSRKKMTELPIGKLLNIKGQHAKAKRGNAIYFNIEDFSIIEKESPVFVIPLQIPEGGEGTNELVTIDGEVVGIKTFIRKEWNNDTRGFDEKETYPFLYKDQLCLSFGLKRNDNRSVFVDVPPQTLGYIQWSDEGNIEGLKTILRTVPVNDPKKTEQQLEIQEEFVRSSLSGLHATIVGMAYVKENDYKGKLGTNYNIKEPVYILLSEKKMVDPEPENQIQVQVQDSEYPQEFYTWLGNEQIKWFDNEENNEISVNILHEDLLMALLLSGLAYQPNHDKVKFMDGVSGTNFKDKEFCKNFYPKWKKLNEEGSHMTKKNNNVYDGMKEKAREKINVLKKLLPNIDIGHVQLMLEKEGIDISPQTIIELMKE